MSKKVSKSYINQNDEVIELDDAWFRTAEVKVGAAPKQSINLRVDEPVLAYYKSVGKGYQTFMQNVLRAYAQAHPKKV